MNRLFIIYTPYQMLSMLNIVEMEDEQNTDCLLMHPNMERYYDKLKRIIHGNVYYDKELYDSTPNHGWIRNHVEVLNNLTRKIKYLEKGKTVIAKYDELFVPSDDTSCRAIYAYLKKREPVKLKLIDDGVGTYSGYIYKRHNVLANTIYKMLAVDEFYEILDEIYCYHPELIDFNPYNVKTTKIQYKRHNKLFEPEIDETKKDYLGKKVIFLDQGLSDKKMVDCLEILKKHFSKNDILIKKHPRIDGNSIYEGLTVTKEGLPFEAIIDSIDTSRCVIISQSSTGCLSPYLLANQEPMIILLRKLYEDYKGSIDSRLFDRINEKTGHTVIHLPKSISELDEMISKALPIIGAAKLWQDYNQNNHAGDRMC